LLKQKLVATRDVQTMATNGKELFFNPEYVVNQRSEYLQFDCAHEALHPAFCHHTRRGNRDWGMWNEACDYVINPILVEAGFHMPPDALYREDLKGLNSEQAFNVLKGEREQDDDGDDDGGKAPGEDEQDTSQPPPQPRPIGDDGDDDQDGDDSQPDDAGQDGDDGAGGDDGDSDDDAEGDSGGAGGQGQDGKGRQQVPSFGGTGAILDAPVADDAERAAEENDWKVATIQAANLAKADPSAGNLPGDLIRQIEEQSNPKANWRELLRKFMQQFARSDYTWATPNRRHISDGLYLPSLQSEKLPPFLFVGDSSGSMPQDALAQARAELQSICDDMQPEFIDVIFHDTRVTTVTRYEEGDELILDAKGGGGTKFAPVVDWINNADEDYAVVIWFTDMEAWDWDQCDEPDVPVLFIDWTGRHDDPHFGEEVIALEDDWS
jgi:predicted metal-dependent peptidase